MDVRYNEIAEFDAKNDLPANVLVLKVTGNPFINKDQEKKVYRKPIVLALEKLEELDKLPVNQAERLAYRGLLPKFNVSKSLKEIEDKILAEEATERMEKELLREI